MLANRESLVSGMKMLQVNNNVKLMSTFKRETVSPYCFSFPETPFELRLATIVINLAQVDF